MRNSANNYTSVANDHNYSAIGDVNNYDSLKWAPRPDVTASSRTFQFPDRQSSTTHISDFTSLHYIDPDKVDVDVKNSAVASSIPLPIQKVTNTWKKVAIGLTVSVVIGMLVILAIVLAVIAVTSISHFLSRLFYLVF